MMSCLFEVLICFKDFMSCLQKALISYKDILSCQIAESLCLKAYLSCLYAVVFYGRDSPTKFHVSNLVFVFLRLQFYFVNYVIVSCELLIITALIIVCCLKIKK